MLIKADPVISIEDASGPRKDVFSAIDDYLILPAQAPTGVDPLISGKVRIHSSSTPHIQGEKQYTINIKQEIKWQSQTETQNSLQQFKVIESPWTLDESAIHSVYPPPGHSDYSNVLPHVVFNNASLPWSMSPSDSEGESSAPWIGLLTFTEDELTASDAALSAQLSPLTNSPTFTKLLTVSQLNDLLWNGLASSSIAYSDANSTDKTTVQTAFVSANLMRGIFGRTHAGGFTLDRFKPMCNVRSVETSGMTNRAGNGQEQFSTVIGVRTGPLDNDAPVAVHAHLVSLYGLLENVNADPMNQRPAALVSLYSWSYTCVPSAGASLHALFRGIGSDVQPLRAPDVLLNQASSGTVQSDDWAKNRILGGYSLLDYRTSDGDPTLAFHRGPLTPFKPAVVDFPPSDYGTDLAIADTFTGILDLSFQLAWELGRLLMANDRSTSAALMRLKRDCHCDSMNVAKTVAVQSSQLHSPPNEIIYIAGKDALNALPNSLMSLNKFKPTDGSIVSGRWGKQQGFQAARETFAFQAKAVQQAYVRDLQNTQAQFSRALPSKNKMLRDSAPASNCFNELNCPMSADYAKLLTWCMDAWYLQGIPFHYMLPDPGFTPKESIRTFYVDQNWFKVFFDGAFSVTEHFTEQDEIRESIKANLDDYLSSPLTKDIPKPLIPRWGFVLRSEVVAKFPDLRISAPRIVEINEDSEHDGRPEVIRKEMIDTDTIIALFDREPTRDQFPDGITLHGPEHQLCNMLGEVGDLTTSQLTFRWKPITSVDIANNTQSQISPTSESSIFLPNDDPALEVFEANWRALRPQALIDAASGMFKLDRTGWTVRADSYETKSLPSQHPPWNVLDGDIHTLWHTQWIDSIVPLPHWIEIDMKKPTVIAGLIYTPRPYPDSFNGTIGRYQIHVSNDQNYTDPPLAQGLFALTRDPTTVTFAPTTCRYVRLKALSEAQNASNQWSSCAELSLLSGIQDTPSLLGSQLVSTVPKLHLTCPANLQAMPTPNNHFSTSKPRPGAIPISSIAPPTIHNPRSLASTPYTPPVPPSAGTTPHLAALGRAELYLDMPGDREIWYYFDNMIRSPVWQGGPGQTHVDSSYRPQSIINIFNIRAFHRTSTTTTQRTEKGLISVLPLSYGFRTNIHVSIGFVDAAWSADLSPGMGTKLVSMQILFPVGTDVHLYSPSPSSLIRPFPADQVPRARTVGKGRRWTATTSLIHTDSDYLAVTITPNTGDPSNANAWTGGQYWDVTMYGDLSFVLEDIQLNGPDDELYSQYLPTVFTTSERYVVNGSGEQAEAKGESLLELNLMNARYAA